MLVQAYEWFYNLFFSGELPEFLAQIAPELSTLGALFVVGCAFMVPIGVFILFIKFFKTFLR